MIVLEKKFWVNISKCIRSDWKLCVAAFFVSCVLSIAQVFGLGAFIPVIHLFNGGDMGQFKSMPFLNAFFERYQFDHQDILLFLITAIFLSIIIRAFFKAWTLFLQQLIKVNIDTYWQRRVVEHWLSLSPLQHNTINRSYVMQLCSQEVANIGRAGAALIIFLSASVQIIFMVMFLCFMSWKLMVAICVFTLVLILPILFLSRSVFLRSQHDMQKTYNYTRNIFDVIKRVELIDIFHTFKKEMGAFQNFLNEFIEARIRLRKASLISPFLVEVLGAALLCGMLIVLSQVDGFSSFFSIDNLLVFVGAIIIIQPQMTQLTHSLNQMARINVSYDRVQDFFKNIPVENDIKAGHYDITQTDELIFDNVSFSYFKDEDETKVLDQASVRFPKNKLTMIFGASGAGKTTLLHLLMRLYRPQSGRICLGDVDVAHFSESSWHQVVTLMTQNNIVFEDSVQNNVAYTQQDQEKVNEAIMLSRAKDFVDQLSEGNHTAIKGDGGTLSGGQCQRIALARILAHDASILLLDEPTSALDRFTENDVMNNLLKLKKHGKTIILSTHKIELAPFADHLIWFEKGKLYDGKYEDFKKNLDQLNYHVKV